MTDISPHRTLLLLLPGLLLDARVAVSAADPQPAVPPDHAQRMKQSTALFRSHVRADLIKHCLKCHGGEAIKGEFDLSTRKSLVENGYVEFGKSKESFLYKLITHEEEPHMPHKAEKLPAETIARIGKWIDLGAAYDKPLVENRGAGAGAPSAISAAERRFWSFQPLNVVSPPAVENADWVRTPVDRFVLQKLEERKLKPNAIADRKTLIRRTYFDLIGLPPKPAEIDAFVGDADTRAYEKLIDRLLESQHYGERWARHWMDVARFAESHGYEQGL